MGKGLPERNADIFYGVVGIDMQIAFGLDLQINQAVPGHLIEHVLEKRDTGIEMAATAAIQVHTDLDLGLQSIAFYRGLAFSHGESSCLPL